MALLTEKHQPFVGPIGITGVSTHRASFARIVCINLDSHRTMHESLIRYHALQLSKRPFGIGGIRLVLLPARFFAFAPFGSISDICQTLQSDQAVWVSCHDAFGDHMIGVGFQPSLSSTDHHQTAGSRTSAFSLQTLPQSRIMVCFGNHLLSRMEGTISPGSCCYSQIAHTNIHTRMPVWVSGVGSGVSISRLTSR